MIAKHFRRPAKTMAAAAALTLSLLSGLSYADKGVIALVNSDCFLINTSTGYVLVGGTTTASPGTVVIGDFRQQGVAKIVNSGGIDVSENAYIQDLGIPRSAVKRKWKAKCSLPESSQ